MNHQKNTKQVFIAIEQYRCKACGNVYDARSILLDKKLQKILKNRMITKDGVCEECRKKMDDGYIALIEINSKKSVLAEGTRVTRPENVYRTGRIAWIKKQVANELFNESIEAMNWINQQAFNTIAKALRS